MEDDPLQTLVQFVRGVGPDRADLLKKLDLRTVEDVLWNLPRDVLDLSDMTEAPQLNDQRVHTVCGVVVDTDGRQLPRGRTLSAVLLNCDGHYVRGVWFNQFWVLKKFLPGQRVLFSAKPKRSGGRWEMSHPKVQWIDDEQSDDGSPPTGGIHPKYSLTEGLQMHEMCRVVRSVIENYAEFIADPLPDAFRSQNQLPVLRQAVRQIHLPKSRQEYDAGRHRLIFDDLLEFQLGLAMRRRAWKRDESAPVLPTTAKIDSRIRRLFPFSFTTGQNEAVHEISADLASGRAMHRLLQADVGAGKTAVALYAILVAIAAGHQAVLMAPTEVLANQHWATVDAALSHSRVDRLLLTGRLTAAQRKQALQQIQDGEVQLIIGTQALIQEDVRFQSLGIAVIDEQHKFGVMQRAHFAGDSKEGSTGVENLRPHVLVMTATPIPRSLCMTQFGDLDITAITDMPPGRQRVVTSRIAGEPSRKRAWDFVRKQLQQGRQAYVVCPRIDGETNSAEPSIGAEQVYEQLRTGELRDFRVDLVHGRLDRDKKTDVMDRFRSGEIQVLVATTVVEVGVDVTNATLMVIYKAESFGLSQLHQLRGRISRGSFQGYCFLFSEAGSPEATQRLTALEQTSDGFKIAETDFKLRGPGDVLGTRQHGDLPLRVANLIRDQKVLTQARKTAFALVDTGEFDTPEFVPLKTRVLERFGRLMDLPQSG